MGVVQNKKSVCETVTNDLKNLMNEGEGVFT